MVSGAYDYAMKMGHDGVQVTIDAFDLGLLGPVGGSFVIMCSLALFAFTTILRMGLLRRRSCEYLFNGSKLAVLVYRWVISEAVLIGPFLTLNPVWTIARYLQRSDGGT